ncbi:MAG: hypothetical protein LBH91_09255 [Prevotellaceae bacterium]|jgi:hypothetical protein|nr:hypothetical protein [Prevotellaceae bacterium]
MKYLSLKRFPLLLYAFSFLLFTPASAQFSGGTGVNGDPYIITTPAQLDSVRHSLSAHFKLNNNIDLGDYLAPCGAGYAQWQDAGWELIGDEYDNISFIGSLDGNGYHYWFMD